MQEEKAGFITPRTFPEDGQVLALQSTRRGGVSPEPWRSLNLGNNTGDEPERVRRNMRLLSAAAGFDPLRTVGSVQVHGTEVLHARQPGRHEGYDAFITDTPDLWLCIFTADCLPVLFYDPEHRAVGAAHAGWQGTAGEIAAKTLDAMRRAFGTRPGACRAWIGTGISGGEYEVGEEVAGRFPERCSAPASGGKRLLDLAAANHLQLVRIGVCEEHIERSPYCSKRDDRLFYSYRRDNGQTGRMASVIGIRPRNPRS
ncbi:peptidoglycan editing factor PgeF [Chlorobium sp. N1]|uniref:peptidoglycan editing factor PgeF n=1 Tax=Chlorobium sp. N1 TaxID=2491138 RepID=UPI0010400F33|nr:peptidoglycan editing factor PgeF [Chlorobium sp. N1]TCD48170.1 peptidoglycan editing factor PgeF [Chlorobium sp. N1]